MQNIEAELSLNYSLLIMFDPTEFSAANLKEEKDNFIFKKILRKSQVIFFLGVLSEKIFRLFLFIAYQFCF